MSEKDTPRWKVNKQRYKVKYNREHSTKICVQFYEKRLSLRADMERDTKQSGMA